MTTTATMILDGKRGKKYRLCISQQHPNDGGGILYRLQEQRTSAKTGVSWHDVASTLEPSGDMAARVIAGWLTTPMPREKLEDLEGNSAYGFKARGPVNPLGGL